LKKTISILIIGILILSGIGTFAIKAYDDDNFDFLIITPSIFSDDLQILKEHKETYEFLTKIVTLDQIYDSVFFPVEGRDDAERIKYFIKNAIESWNTNYIMFVGGKEIMPVRYSVISFNSHIEGEWPFLFPDISCFNSNGFITDLYYADIYDQNGSFCSWDSNNNDVFGEIGLDEAIDEVDLCPDVFIGRILCQTTQEVEIIVNKIIDYENNMHGKEWFNNIILCGGDTHPNTWEEILLSLVFKNITGMNYRLAWEGEYMCDEVAKCLDTFTAKKLYSSGFFRIRAKQLTIRNINQAINDGAGFLLFSMHGTPTKLITYPPFNKKYTIQLPSPSGYDISNIEELTNYDKLPIAVFGACSNGDFDTVSSPIAWEFVKYPDGGAIASFALTTGGNIYPTTMYTESLSGHTTMSIFEAYSDGIDILGEIWAETIKRYLDDDIAWSVNEHLNSDGDSIVWLNFLALEEWMLFGDPTLKIGGYE
jgi:hypothetical protein